MVLQTERLLLYPLNANQLALYAQDIPTLEKELGVSYQAEAVEGFFQTILQGQVTKVLENQQTYLYHTFWLLIRKEDRVVVGSADFKSPPNENGEIEIGYGLGSAFVGNGYMSETVKAMCQWALAQPEVTHVIAETEKDNLPSQNVLTRCGFTQYKQEDTLWWRL